MKKKKMLLVLLILIIAFIICLFYGYSSDKEDSEKPKRTIIKICDNINSEIKEKNTFLVFLVNDLEELKNSDSIVSKYVKNYEKDNKIFVIGFKDIKEDCVKQIFKKDNMYEQIIAFPSNSYFGYKDGVLSSFMINMSDYILLENKLHEDGIIKKHERKESATFEQIKKNIEKDEYILFILAQEETREKYEKLLNEVFSDYDYDYINYFGKEGEKVYSYIKKDLESDNVFPKILYYKNGKIVEQAVLSEKSQMQEFKKKIQSLS